MNYLKVYAKYYSTMFKYLLLVALLVCTVSSQDQSDYIPATIEVSQILELQLPQYTIEVSMSFISIDESSFSAYLLDSDTFTSDYSSNDYSNGDLLNGYCTNFLQCNTSALLNPNINYVIVIKNNNLLEDGIIGYYLDYWYYSTGSTEYSTGSTEYSTGSTEYSTSTNSDAIPNSNYIPATIEVSQILELSLPQYTIGISMSFISIDGSSFSAYLLDSNTFTSDYSSGDYSNGDLLNGDCTNFLQCNTSALLNPGINYVIVIKNNNLLEDGTVEYNLNYWYYSTGSTEYSTRSTEYSTNSDASPDTDYQDLSIINLPPNSNKTLYFSNTYSLSAFFESYENQLFSAYLYSQDSTSKPLFEGQSLYRATIDDLNYEPYSIVIVNNLDTSQNIIYALANDTTVIYVPIILNGTNPFTYIIPANTNAIDVSIKSTQIFTAYLFANNSTLDLFNSSCVNVTICAYDDYYIDYKVSHTIVINGNDNMFEYVITPYYKKEDSGISTSSVVLIILIAAIIVLITIAIIIFAGFKIRKHRRNQISVI